MKAVFPARLTELRRTGFTFVEMVVILVIAAVVVSLALTLLLRMRERGYLLACENNLRQIGEAVYLYRDHAKPHALPPSRIADGYATWAVLIAPYLTRNQGGGLSAWDVGRPYCQQPDEVRGAQVSVYYCPARRSPGLESISGDEPPDDLGKQRHYPGALSDYASAAGDGDPAHPWTTAQANGALLPAEVLKHGPDHTITRWQGRTDFRLRQEDGRADVLVREGEGPAGEVHEALKRGTSKTILIGDKHVRPGDFGRAEEGDGSVYDGARPANFSRIGGPGHGLARSPTAPFDLRFPIFGSWHTGGLCQFVMADGHVEGILPTIDEAVLGRLMVREED